MVVLNLAHSVPMASRSAARPTGQESVPLSKVSYFQGHQVPLHQVPARCALPAGAYRVDFHSGGACNLGNSYMPPAIGGAHQFHPIRGAAAPASYVPQPQGVAAPVRHHVPAVGHIQQGSGMSFCSPSSSYLPAPVRGAAAPVSHVPAALQGLVNQLMPPIEFKFYPDPRPSNGTDALSTTQRTPQFAPVSRAPAETHTGANSMAKTSFPLPTQSFIAPQKLPGKHESKGRSQAISLSSKQLALTFQKHISMPCNKICADCGAASPQWASVNLGVTICIECAGCHRSLGAHVSKVKSLTLDDWKPQEVECFTALGGNFEVNDRLLRRGGPKPPARGSCREIVADYIRTKYGGEKSEVKGGPPREQHEVSPLVGVTCHQGLVLADIETVDIGVDRAWDLRTFGPTMLSLSVELRLGPQTADATAKRRGSAQVGWTPPERRQLLWDAEEQYLQLRVFDGGELGFPQLAGEGHVDLLKFVQNGHRRDGVADAVEVDLFAPKDAVEASKDEASPASSSSSTLEDNNPSLCLIGKAKLKVTIIDMSGMLATQVRKRISASPFGSSGSE